MLGAWLGNLLIGLAGGMGVSLISGHVGYGGVAIGFAAGGILLGAVRLRRFPEEVRLVRVSSRAMLIVAAGCTILAAVVSVFTDLPWSGYAILGAALFALGAAVIPLDRYGAVRALGGIACIGVGVSLISNALGLLLDFPVMTWEFSQVGGGVGPLNGIVLTALIGAAMPFTAAMLAITGIGISLIGAGSALLLHRTTLLSVTGVGLGVSLIGAGIASLSFDKFNLLGPWLIAAGVIAVTGAGIGFPLVHHTLFGVAAVGLGVSFISAGVAWLLLSGAQIVGAVVGLGVSLISAGITAIGVGAALLLAEGILTAAACAGFGISLIGTGVASQFWGWTALAAWLIALGVLVIGVALLFARGILTAARVGFGISLIGAAVATFLIHDTLAWIEPLSINNGVVAVLDMGVVVGTWTAIGVAVTALVGGVVLPLARGTLVGISGICLGVSLIDLDHPGGGRVWLLIALVSVFDLYVRFPCAGGVRGLPGRARVRTGSDRARMASFRVAGVVRAGHAGAGRAEMRCQQVMNAVFHGQSRLIFRVRRRAWRTSRAGTCHSR